MGTIQEKEIIANRANKIRSAMILRGLTIRKWSISNGHTYNLVHQVITGECGKLQSLLTKSGKIQQQLKAEGFWPEEEAQP